MSVQTKKHSQMSSFSTLLHETFALLEKYFLEFLFAVAIPLIVFFTFFWTVLGMFTVDFNTVETYSDLLQMVSLQNSTTLFAIIALCIIAFMNILGFIATPLVAVKHGDITVQQIFPQSLRYFGPALLMIIMMGVIYFLLLIISYILVTIFLTITALFDISAIDSMQATFTNIIPSFFIIIASFLFTFAPFVLIDKNKGAWHAITTSVELVKNNFAPLLIRAVLLMIILSLVVFIIQFIPIVGKAMATILGVIILTSYNYILYREVNIN